MNVRWTETASNQIENVFEHIASDNIDAAVRIVERILAATERAAQLPFSARAGKHSGTRELIVSGTPYIVIYRIREEGIQILRVVHGAQNWK